MDELKNHLDGLMDLGLHYDDQKTQDFLVWYETGSLAEVSKIETLMRTIRLERENLLLVEQLLVRTRWVIEIDRLRMPPKSRQRRLRDRYCSPKINGGC